MGNSISSFGDWRSRQQPWVSSLLQEIDVVVCWRPAGGRGRAKQQLLHGWQECAAFWPWVACQSGEETALQGLGSQSSELSARNKWIVCALWLAVQESQTSSENSARGMCAFSPDCFLPVAMHFYNFLVFLGFSDICVYLFFCKNTCTWGWFLCVICICRALWFTCQLHTWAFMLPNSSCLLMTIMMNSLISPNSNLLMRRYAYL